MYNNVILLSNIFILGVGESTAQKWYGKGYRTIEDILKHEHLSYQQKVGIQLYNVSLKKKKFLKNF